MGDRKFMLPLQPWQLQEKAWTGWCWYQKRTLQSLFSAATERTALLIWDLWGWRTLPFVVRPSIFESAVCLLRLSIEKDGRSTCRQKKYMSLMLQKTEGFSSSFGWNELWMCNLAHVFTPGALPAATLHIGTGLSIPIGPHQVSASCQRTLWHVGCRVQRSNHWPTNQWTATLTPELQPTATNG